MVFRLSPCPKFQPQEGRSYPGGWGGDSHIKVTGDAGRKILKLKTLRETNLGVAQSSIFCKLTFFMHSTKLYLNGQI